MTSFAKSDYNIEDWIPVIEPFDNHPRLEPRSPFHNHRDQIKGSTDVFSQDILDKLNDRELDRLDNPEQNHELELFYTVEDVSGEIEAWCSTEYRQEGNMLEGLLTFETRINGLPIAEKQEQLVEENNTPYLRTNPDMEPGDHVTLAYIEVPENYEPSTLQETVQATVDIYDEVHRLEKALEKTTREY